jgi:hypothetical protein
LPGVLIVGFFDLGWSNPIRGKSLDDGRDLSYIPLILPALVLPSSRLQDHPFYSSPVRDPGLLAGHKGEGNLEDEKGELGGIAVRDLPLPTVDVYFFFTRAPSFTILGIVDGYSSRQRVVTPPMSCVF